MSSYQINHVHVQHQKAWFTHFESIKYDQLGLKSETKYKFSEILEIPTRT